MSVQPKITRYALELLINQADKSILRGQGIVDGCSQPEKCDIGVANGIPTCTACAKEVFTKVTFEVSPK